MIKELKKIKPKYYIFPGMTEARAEFIEARVKFNALIETVCSFYKVRAASILSTSRKRLYLKPRYVIIYLLSTEKGIPSTWLGEFMYRDHTTILYAINQVKGWIETGDDIGDDILEVKKILADTVW
jgi:chromosomal replication initiation ATPase DnaA